LGPWEGGEPRKKNKRKGKSPGEPMVWMNAAGGVLGSWKKKIPRPDRGKGRVSGGKPEGRSQTRRWEGQDCIGEALLQPRLRTSDTG